jgi:hypothetical protein
MTTAEESKIEFQKNIRLIGTIGLKLKYGEVLSEAEKTWLSNALIKIYFGDYVHIAEALGINSPDHTTIKSVSDFDRKKIAIEAIFENHTVKNKPFSKALEETSAQMGITPKQLKKDTKKYYPNGTKDNSIENTIEVVARKLGYKPEALAVIWNDKENRIFRGHNSWSDLDRLLKKNLLGD